MMDGPIGKIILFWIYIVGALFFARVLGFVGDTKATVIFLIACAIVYVVWVVGRSMAKRRREEQEYAAAPRKGKKGR
jgi:Flp pilus assembly protein TadB